jgi:hypothetical protein
MDLKRRITLYLFGAIIGIGLAYLFFGERLTTADWLPEERIKKRLSQTLVASRPEAREQLDRWPAELSDLRRSMSDARVDLGNSIRTPDSIYYSVEATVNDRPAHLLIAVTRDIDRDTTATLWEIVPR